MSQTYISGTHRSGPALIIEFGPRGIDGICVLHPEDLELIREMKPKGTVYFQDEQKVQWKVYLSDTGYLLFEAASPHGLIGSISFEALKRQAAA